MFKKQFRLSLAIVGMILSTTIFANEECSVAVNDQAQMQIQGNPQYSANQYPGDQGAPQNGAVPMGRLQWVTNYLQAIDQAKRENKYLLLFFTGSDWCGWCKKMDSEVFSDPAFAKAVANRFVFVDLDFPMNKMQPPELAQQNAGLKQKFGISGFPTIVILDSNQNFVAETGYRPGGGQQFANYLIQLTQNQGS